MSDVVWEKVIPLFLVLVFVAVMVLLAVTVH
jgi:hypothetical protein